MKKLFLVWSLIMMVVFVPVLVKADSFRFGVTANKTTIKAGDTVTINLSVNDIDAGELGINTVEGKLLYDSSIFEDVKSSDFTGSNGWSITYNDGEEEQKGKILGVLLQTGTKKNQEIGKLKLKVKENVKVGETSITITNIATNNGSELIKDSDKKVQFKIQKTEGNSNSDNNNSKSNSNSSRKNNSNSNNNNNNTKSESATTKKAQEKKSKNRLPYTGDGNFIIAIIAVLLISIFLYIKYKKYKSINK